jgi:hypothetical protein
MGADVPIPPASEECRRPRRDAPAADQGRENLLARYEGSARRPSDSEGGGGRRSLWNVQQMFS